MFAVRIVFSLTMRTVAVVPEISARHRFLLFMSFDIYFSEFIRFLQIKSSVAGQFVFMLEVFLSRLVRY